MGMKRRGSELDHEAKKIKSDDSIGNDKVSSSNRVQTTPASPHQPVAGLGALPQTAREQIAFLLQALSDVSPESLSGVSILDQINTVNSDGRWPPNFKYKPPYIDIMIGYEHGTFSTVLISELNMLISLPGGDIAHDCEKSGCNRIFATVAPQAYATGFFRVNILRLASYTAAKNLAFPYLVAKHPGLTFQKKPWKEAYRLKVQSLARKAVVSHNRQVLSWWMRKIAHAETPFAQFNGREEARGQFLSGDVEWTTACRDAWRYR
ncbi:hypothetical protein FMUND_12672 [Fusarium mundagurra]|uniref:Uncharacterized protein n=1 Tax=Fusarium mundagurra TaxID=1567541 RepID=A0A8H6D5I6_9HYPO|nr:hypothetical protein FMUND_12672 [Fusarium mundagurra]